ncbi:thioredoxin domain-containing protein [Cyanothece sp. BG0011]|uniref:TlpA family protein disulfide reductase n=1 Tax=Cyanothece sp. BG0011 TaxID=2082950 RepID=UPI000D1F67A4|nr:thioredoxin domain-containing protein [Cyanothece sp. BG0011]
MFPKSTSLWLSLYLTSVVIPFSLVTNHEKVSASNDVSTSQLHACAGSSRRNVGGPLARELQGKPVVVDIYASWCAACKNIAPTLSQLKQQYQGKAYFVVLDVSDQAKARQAEARARQLGLGDFFAQHKSQTGTVTIVDPANGNILTQHRNNNKLSDYTSVLDAAISQR